MVRGTWRQQVACDGGEEEECVAAAVRTVEWPQAVRGSGNEERVVAAIWQANV